MQSGSDGAGKSENHKSAKQETGSDVTRRRREPAERMLRIHERLTAGEYPNCFGLAKEFEVSYKTVARDVEYMRDHFELPIEYDIHKHGFFYAKTVERFPGTSEASDTEMFALAVAHKATAQYEGLPFQETLAAGFKKMHRRIYSPDKHRRSSLFDAVSFRPMGVDMVDGRALLMIVRAVAERRSLIFSYRKPGEATADTRRVLPYHVACIDNRFYLLAHDNRLGEVQKFTVARMTSPLETGDHFERPKDFDPTVYLSTAFGVMTGHADYEVLIEFDAWATDVMRGRRWHKRQVVAELDGGRSIFCVRISCLDEVERWVLSWGAHARVIEPRELEERVVQIAAAIGARYRPDS